MRAFPLALPVIAALAAGCGARRGPISRPTASARVTASSPPPSLAPPLPPPPTPSAALLHAAETMDPVDLSGVAATDGADRLAALLDDPRVHAAALQAIAYADDAEVAFARLTKRAREKKGPDASAALDVLERSLERPSRRGEILDDEGVHAAIGDLRAIAADASAPAPDRALAVSILRRLADRGFLDRP